jgi:hypothetical protein
MLQLPSKTTLAKYGLTLVQWQLMAQRQNHVCFVCKKLPPSGRLCVDHEHVKNWKKMPPNKRRLYVRGLLCGFCNYRLVAKGITLAKAREVVSYLEQYEARKRRCHIS